MKRQHFKEFTEEEKKSFGIYISGSLEKQSRIRY